ncbi:MAG: DUF4405 domain-containing protein [Proteobacteria bacterium]|nr:cytochrome B [Pseudomonadota bacterium]NOG59445.1 DUF4405 domain-containing protein [Pseudomonadota bacterium]
MSNEIRVWDPLVRIFHWSLVLAFTVAYLSGEEESSVHIYAGYVVLGLISFRLAWGFIGSHHARFKNFIYSPKRLTQYLKSLMAKKPEHYLGHNPAGGYMIVAMLTCLVVVTISGLKVYAIEEGKGLLAANTPTLTIINSSYADSNEYEDDEDDEYESGYKGDKEGEEFWEEIHEISSNLMLLLIFLHVAGVVVSSRLHGENLVKAMFNGKKHNI